MNLLTKLVVPLYYDHRGRPTLHGTAFFVRSGASHFLVSAAHVLEVLRDRPLYFYITPDVTRKLTGKLLLTPPLGNRDGDLLDVGVLKLTDEGNPPYQAVEKFAMDASYLKPALVPRSEKQFVIVGFPASQKLANPRNRNVVSAPFAFRNSSIDKGPPTQNSASLPKATLCCRWI